MLTMNKISQKISNKSQFKQKLDKFIANNIDPNIGINRMLTFAKRNRVTVSTDLEEYRSGHLTTMRIRQAILLKLIAVSIALRFSISSAFNQRSVLIVMSDPNKSQGNQRLISFMAVFISTLILLIDTFNFIREVTHTSTFLSFVSDFTQNRVIPLSARNYSRLAFRLNLVSKCLIELSFWPLVIASTVFLNGTVIIHYLDPNSGFTLLSIIPWGILSVIFIVGVFAQAFSGCVAITFVVFYLKYKFDEILAKFRTGLKLKDRSILMRAISEHNFIGKRTDDLNDFFRFVIFLLYFFATIPLMILVNLVFDKDTSFYFRLFAGVVFILGILTVFH